MASRSRYLEKAISDEIAAEYAVPVLAKIPMDPTLAAACDAGKIEYVENNYMKDAIEVLKKL